MAILTFSISAAEPGDRQEEGMQEVHLLLNAISKQTQVGDLGAWSCVLSQT